MPEARRNARRRRSAPSRVPAAWCTRPPHRIVAVRLLEPELDEVAVSDALQEMLADLVSQQVTLDAINHESIHISYMILCKVIFLYAGKGQAGRDPLGWDCEC